MNTIYLFIPVISALIGWFTNFLVVKFLFWPRTAYKVPLANFYIQGVFGRRKPEIARAISQVVSQDLMSREKMIESIDREEASKNMVDFTETKIAEVVDKRLSTLLPTAVKKKISDIITNIIKEDLNETVNEDMERLLKDGIEQVKIEEIIEREINSLDVKEVEKISFKVASKEFKFIEVFGGVLGFVIGTVQLIIIGLF